MSDFRDRRESHRETSASCPAVFIAAPASGQGKTTVTAALARMLRRRSKVVRVFKTGPDYLDPRVLAQASGRSVDPLDLWMAGETYCRRRLFEAAQEADLILVEGAMGLFDGEPPVPTWRRCSACRWSSSWTSRAWPRPRRRW